MDIRVIDSNFAHATSCSNGDLKIYPKYFNWYRGSDNKDITVFVDHECRKVHQITSKYKIWMLLEPHTISGHLYQLARSPIVQSQFDMILTFDRSLVACNPEKIKYYPVGGCWIEPADRQIYKKTKNISIIASEKNATVGHRLRHELIRRLNTEVDVFGRGYKFIPSKLEALKDYRFSIIIENCQVDGYFTEKIIDAMVTGTIPLYYGDPKIDKVFDPAGLVTFDSTLDSFMTRSAQIRARPEVMYDHCFQTVYKNFELAKQFVNTEDWLWEAYFKNICTTIPKT